MTVELSTIEPRANTLDAERYAVAAAGTLVRLAATVSGPLKSVADQALRAAASVPLNIAEGAGRQGRDRLHHYRIAYASAREAAVAAELLVAAQLIDAEQAGDALQTLDRVRAMLWRLGHPLT